MPTAVIIGFEYKVNKLTGAIVDIYRAYNWCESFGCNIYVLTDIINIKTTVVKHEVKDARGLLDNISKILDKEIKDNKLILYYSGHGKKESMVMPDQSLLSFVKFRDEIINILSETVEIFWILDCCNPNGLYLPYKLEKEHFILSSLKIKCVKQPIMLITSAEPHEKSIATKNGSIFSENLFRILSELNNDDDIPITRNNKVVIPITKNRNLTRLINNLTSSMRKLKTGYTQTVSVYSSYITDPVLWMWIGSSKKYDIVTDITLSTLIIRPNININKNNDNKNKNNISYTDDIIDDEIVTIQNPYDLIYTEY